jgi:hypothetical protein
VAAAELARLLVDYRSFLVKQSVPSAAELLFAGADVGPLSFLLRFDIEPVAYTFKLPLFFNDIMNTSQSIVIFL